MQRLFRKQSQTINCPPFLPWKENIPENLLNHCYDSACLLRDLFSVLTCPCQSSNWSIILNNEYLADSKSNHSDIYKRYSLGEWDEKWWCRNMKSLSWDNNRLQLWVSIYLHQGSFSLELYFHFGIIDIPEKQSHIKPV